MDYPIGLLNETERKMGQREAEIRAFLPEPGRFARLAREYEQMQVQFASQDRLPPLIGLLLGVKDIFRVDGFATQAGSQLPSEVLDGAEAWCVTQLKQAGCLILGKTVTTEFAYFAPGPTRNPHNLAHTPGGSSSGSAAAVAADFCPLALGSQTIGSIIRPAAFCGVFGYKPSYDRVSRQGVIPLSPSLDHVGFFCSDLNLAGRAAAVLCQDWRPERAPLHRRPILAIPEGPYLEKVSPAGRDHFAASLANLREAGFEIRSLPMFSDFEAVVERHNRILAAEAARVHRDWFREYSERYHSRTARLIEEGAEIDVRRLEEDLGDRLALREQIGEQMRRSGIDLWLSPAAPGIAPRGLESTGDPVMNLPWTQAGLPALNIPSGEIDGLPLGLQVTAGWYADEALLAWAQGISQSLGKGLGNQR